MKNITLFLITLLNITTFAQVILPIEVLGEEGKIVNREIDISNEIANATDSLWLQINNLGYENKASVKVNSGNWYTLNHSSVLMAPQEKSRGGMVHGGFGTLRFSIPAQDFQAGKNTLRFRFNTSDGISMGYRVIRFNLLNSASEKLLDASYFEEENPDLWVGPYTDDKSIAEGKKLWESAPLWTSKYPGKWYAHDLGGFTPIQAKCADCHTQDGRDLELFAYSNEAIIERSKFHNLSQNEGELIASYIRTLTGKHLNVNRAGRPWNPPYQPGPSLKGQPIEKWAAGAGLDAVLEDDKDMKDHLFPGGINQTTMHDYFDSDEIENVTEIPLSIQLPDWKHWLPLIHPKDAYTKNNFWNDYSLENNPQRAYEAMRTFLESDDINSLADNQIKQKIRDFWSNNRLFLTQGGNCSNHWRCPDGDATKALANGVPREVAATSLAKLMAVKFFEIYNEFNLQDKASRFIPASDQPSDRQWLGSHYQVFEVPAHFQACVEAEGSDGACNNFVGQSKATGKFESTAWYQLQAIINPGMGQLGSTAPVDWNYHPRHILDASYTSGTEEPLRYFQSINLMYQTRIGWSGDQGPTSEGFRMRNMGPWVAYGWDGNNRTGGYANGVFPTFLDNIEPGMSKWVINAQLRQFLDEMDKTINNLNDWARTPLGEWSSEAIETDKITFADLDFDAIYSKNPFGHYVEKVYHVIPEYARMGVDCQIVDELIDWSQEAWPLINWNQFRDLAEPQVILSHQNDCDNYIEARTSNTGNNPTYEWKVNGVVVFELSNQLSSEFYTEGDTVEVRVLGTASCATKNSPTVAELIVKKLPMCMQTGPIDSAYYSFEDNDFSGQIMDQWNDNHLTNSGATSIQSVNQGHAFFDGTDDFMNSSSNQLQFNNPKVSVQSWVKLQTGLNQIQRIVTLAPQDALLVRISNNNKIQVVINAEVGASNSKQTITTTSDLPHDEWALLSTVVSSDSVQIYLNNQLQISSALNRPMDFDGTGEGLQIFIGNAGATPSGSIDEVKIYNRLLDPLEIQESYTNKDIIVSTDDNNPKVFPLVQNTLFSDGTLEIPRADQAQQITIRNLMGAALKHIYIPAGKGVSITNLSELGNGSYTLTKDAQHHQTLIINH